MTTPQRKRTAKLELVLNRDPSEFDPVNFWLSVDDDTYSVDLPWWEWEQMRKPEKLTVTITPGDRLSDA